MAAHCNVTGPIIAVSNKTPAQLSARPGATIELWLMNSSNLEDAPGTLRVYAKHAGSVLGRIDGSNFRIPGNIPANTYLGSCSVIRRSSYKSESERGTLVHTGEITWVRECSMGAGAESVTVVAAGPAPLCRDQAQACSTSPKECCGFSFDPKFWPDLNSAKRWLYANGMNDSSRDAWAELPNGRRRVWVRPPRCGVRRVIITSGAEGILGLVEDPGSDQDY